MPTLYTFFFFNDTATTEIYTLSLHDALPISPSRMSVGRAGAPGRGGPAGCGWNRMMQPCASTLAPAGVWGHLSRLSGDRKSTRLNSSHGYISYAVFCLKKKKNTKL